VLIGLSQDPEKMKAMIAFKKRLEDQLEKLNSEAKEIQATLDAVNGILLTTGFKRGDIKDAAATAPAMKEVVLPKPAEHTKPQAPPSQAATAAPAAPAAPAEQETVIPLKAMNEEP
jgi:hypothetical protein